MLTDVFLLLGLILQRHSKRQILVAVELRLEPLGLVGCLHGGVLLDQLCAPGVPSLAKVLLVALGQRKGNTNYKIYEEGGMDFFFVWKQL